MNKIPLNLAIVMAVVAFPLSLCLSESAQAASVTNLGTENGISNLGSVNSEPPSLPNSNQSGNFFIIPSNPNVDFSVNSGGSSSSIPVSNLSSNSSGGSSSTSSNSGFSTPFSFNQNGLTASDFLAQTRLFAKYKIGMTQRGISPVKIEEYSVAPDVLEGIPLSKDLLYSLDGISVVYEGIGLGVMSLDVKQVKYEEPNSVLNNTSSQFNPLPNGTEISAYFKPQGQNVGDVAIGNLAKVMGFSHFNWLQQILNVPQGISLVSNGQILVSDGQELKDTLYDPAIGGHKIYIHDPDSEFLIPSLFQNADNLPYYLDVPGYNPGGVFDLVTSTQVANEFSLKFFDAPLLTVVIKAGDEMKFKTTLVGVSESNASSFTPLDFDFLWVSNRGCKENKCWEKNNPEYIGGILATSVNRQIYPQLEALLDGGVEILEINGVPVLNSTPSVTNSQSVPEPSNLIGLLGIGIALRFGTKRKVI